MESLVILTLCGVATTWAGEIQCDGTVTGNVETNYDEVSYDFFNPVAGFVAFTDCESDFDTQMRIYNEQGVEITGQSNNACDGDDCYSDAYHCGNRGLRETIPYNNLAAGTYTIKLKPWWHGGNYVIRTICQNADPAPGVYNDIVGTYIHGNSQSYGDDETRISRTTGREIKVDMSPRPIATGVYYQPVVAGAYGHGYVDFPDDRRYYYFFYPEEGTIYWDGERGRTTNFWIEQDITGCYGATGIFRTVSGGDAISVDMTAFGRATGQGTYDKDTQSGSVDFSDDKTYDFQFDTTEGKIDWGLYNNLQDNNMWTKSQPDIVGVYGNPVSAAVIYRAAGNTIKVDMSTAGRPTASGVVNCPARGADTNIFTGYVTFPDDRKYNLFFDRRQGKIFWDHPEGQTYNIWQKFGHNEAEDFRGAHSVPFNINLDWKDPKANDGFKIVVNGNVYFILEILVGLLLILVVVNLACCYSRQCHKNNKGYKVVKYDTDGEFIDSEANLVK